MVSDEQLLIERVLEGDRDAFAELVGRYQNRVFGFIMRMTANRDAALDLTQDSFLAAFENLSRFRRESSFSTWLFQIASNKTKNYLRKSKQEVGLPEGIEQIRSSSQPDKEFEKEIERARLLKAVAVLPTRQKITFNLRFYEEMKFEQIGRIMECSVSTAKNNFAEAVKKLKKSVGGK